MQFVEKIGKTVDEAITEALIELGITTDQATIEIIHKGSKGFLGIGAKNARVRVAVKELVEDDLLLEVEETTKEVFEQPKEEQIEDCVKSDVEPADVKNAQTGVEESQALINTEEAIQKATAFLTKVLKEMGIEAVLEVNIQSSKMYINITGEKMGVVIGKRGETLDSLQYLTNIVINKNKESYYKVILDTENYRKRREETLQKVALKYAKKATQLRKPIALEPMNPYDRRIIHSVLQNSKYVKTHSEGREPFRKVVITPYYKGKSYKK